MDEALLFPREQIWLGREHLRRSERQIISSGDALLDAWLPLGGWQKGSIIECLLPVSGFGEMELLLPLMEKLALEHNLLIVGAPWEPQAAGWLQRGVSLERLCFVATRRNEDVLWIIDQALGSGCFSLVVAWVPGIIRNSQWQRLRKSIQGQSVLLWLMRPYESRLSPSAADCRLGVTPDSATRDLRVHPLRFKGKPPAGVLRWKSPVSGHGGVVVSFAS